MKIISEFGTSKTNNCILGISVGSNKFTKTLIKKYIEFCIEMYDETLIVIVDYPKRHNWKAMGKTEEEGTKKALFEGKELKNAITKIKRELIHEKKIQLKWNLLIGMNSFLERALMNNY
jgi:hypothetical protein